MAATIIVTKIHEDNTGFVFEVGVGQYVYKVTLTKTYWQKLAQGKIEPEELMEKSFKFLLEREPASSILPEFDLPLIAHYFSEYETTIG